MNIKNSFKLLTAQQISNDRFFLKLLEPKALDIFVDNSSSLWNRIVFFRSSPGGGKTTLLTIFTPRIIKTLLKYKTDANYSEIYTRLENIGVIDHAKINVLGVLIPCARDSGYESIDYLIEEYAKNQKEMRRKLLFSLLNSRIILMTIRRLVEFCDLASFNDLKKLSFNYNQGGGFNGNKLPNNCTALELYNWACEREKAIFKIIEGYQSFPLQDDIIYDNALDSLFFLNSINFTFEGNPLNYKLLIMMDDAHFLSVEQQEEIINYIKKSRPRVSIWFAERYNNVDAADFFSEGDRNERDYVQISLENYWHGMSHNSFNKLLENLAYKRIDSERSVMGINNISDLFKNALEEELYESILETKITRVKEMIKNQNLYKEWIKRCEKKGAQKERTICWSVFEILLHRKQFRPLSEFIPVLKEVEEKMPGYGIEGLEEKLKNSAIRKAAEYLLFVDFHMPYYYSWEMIKQLSSYNIEQFLFIMSELFEEIHSMYLLGKVLEISPKKQEKIIRASVEKRINSILDKMPNKENVWKILNYIKEQANYNSRKRNAPYAPGVTGIGIKKKAILLLKEKNYPVLAKAFSDCLKQNLLQMQNIKQNNEEWVVFYLNRMLCVSFNLPLNYGRWLPNKISVLNNVILKKNTTSRKG